METSRVCLSFFLLLLVSLVKCELVGDLPTNVESVTEAAPKKVFSPEEPKEESDAPLFAVTESVVAYIKLLMEVEDDRILDEAFAQLDDEEKEEVRNMKDKVLAMDPKNFEGFVKGMDTLKLTEALSMFDIEPSAKTAPIERTKPGLRGGLTSSPKRSSQEYSKHLTERENASKLEKLEEIGHFVMSKYVRGKVDVYRNFLFDLYSRGSLHDMNTILAIFKKERADLMTPEGVATLVAEIQRTLLNTDEGGDNDTGIPPSRRLMSEAEFHELYKEYLELQAAHPEENFSFQEQEDGKYKVDREVLTEADAKTKKSQGKAKEIYGRMKGALIKLYGEKAVESGEVFEMMENEVKKLDSTNVAVLHKMSDELKTFIENHSDTPADDVIKMILSSTGEEELADVFELDKAPKRVLEAKAEAKTDSDAQNNSTNCSYPFQSSRLDVAEEDYRHPTHEEYLQSGGTTQWKWCYDGEHRKFYACWIAHDKDEWGMGGKPPSDKLANEWKNFYLKQLRHEVQECMSAAIQTGSVHLMLPPSVTQPFDSVAPGGSTHVETIDKP